MHVGWLIDGDMFEAYRDELVAAIRAQGHEAQLVHAPSPPYRWDDDGCSYRKAFPQDACVVVHGDIELISRVRQDGRWRPGAFATIENYNCSNYYCWFGKHLLSQDYIMLPFGELERCQGFLFDTLGRDDKIFVRPDSPLKLFTGQLATRASFDADLEFMGFYEFPPQSLVVVSAPKTITAEWRFVAANKKIASGSLYSQNQQFQPTASVDDAARNLAERIADSGYEPDPVWIIDICQTDDGAYHLLEIGGFSFANLYACDMSKIVAAVSEAALHVWRSANG